MQHPLGIGGQGDHIGHLGIEGVGDERNERFRTLHHHVGRHRRHASLLRYARIQLAKFGYLGTLPPGGDWCQELRMPGEKATEEKQSFIAEAATVTLDEIGYANASLAQIAKCAGSSTALIS